jgi:hypothetical protein
MCETKPQPLVPNPNGTEVALRRWIEERSQVRRLGPYRWPLVPGITLAWGTRKG